jgi:hypothetical protein
LRFNKIHANWRALLLYLLLGSALPAETANPVISCWRLNPQAAAANAILRNALTDVHSVAVLGRFVYVESAGLALRSLAPLGASGSEPPLGLQHFIFRFPLNPAKAEGANVSTPRGALGALVNGVPIYNVASAVSYRGQNLWHRDATVPAPAQAPLLSALLLTSQKHSPLIGFAFDGYPIYGPRGWDVGGQAQQGTRSFRSSYRLRAISERTALPDRTNLTPAQAGPPVNPEFPLGTFVEDYEFVEGSGDLDGHNGRWAHTPEYPAGTYAYFLGTDATNRMMYPYLVGPTYFGGMPASKVESAGPSAMVRRKPLDLGDVRVVTLSTPPHPQAGIPQMLSFFILSERGLRLRHLETVHEKPIHLVIVSKDLNEFAHIHPELQPDNSFAVAYTFPRGGEYWLFADFTRPGNAQTVARFRIQLEGDTGVSHPLTPDASFTKQAGSLRVTFTRPVNLRTGADHTFHFDAVDIATGKPATDLEPYLGAWAHVLIVPETKRTLIHAHPLEDSAPVTRDDPWQHAHAFPTSSPSGVTIVTGFRLPGFYRMWVQFQRNGEVITVPYTIQVNRGAALRHEVIPDAIHVEVSGAGFHPSRLTAVANQPLRIAFERKDAENCASVVLFPDFNLRRQLPPGQTTVVELPAMSRRELSFSCGMGMYRGNLLVR